MKIQTKIQTIQDVSIDIEFPCIIKKTYGRGTIIFDEGINLLTPILKDNKYTILEYSQDTNFISFMAYSANESDVAVKYREGGATRGAEIIGDLIIIAEKLNQFITLINQTK